MTKLKADIEGSGVLSGVTELQFRERTLMMNDRPCKLGLAELEGKVDEFRIAQDGCFMSDLWRSMVHQHGMYWRTVPTGGLQVLDCSLSEVDKEVMAARRICFICVSRIGRLPYYSSY